MSRWTHLNAAIRYDGIPGLTQEPDLGNAVSFEDSEEDFDACDVPCGSEGSIQYSIVDAGTGLIWKSAHIWGDLRDYDNAQEIKDYLSRIVEGQSVRSGIAHIDIEGRPAIHLVYDAMANLWRELNI